MLIFDYDYYIAFYLFQGKTRVVHSYFSIKVNKDISFEKS